MTEEKRQHLEFIQNVVNRLSDKSVQLKAITITLTAGLLAVYASEPKIFLIYITIPQVIFFWFLDSYYLQQERIFRAIYNDVAGITNNVAILDYEMPTKNYKGWKYSILRAFLSLTKLLFFGSIVLILTLLLCAIKHNYFS